MSLIGYDFNGVVDTSRFKPSINDVIITGNTHVEGVLDWLRDHNIKCAVYFPPDKRMSQNRYAVAVWKSEMVRRLQLTKFYEDDTLQWEIISQSCFDCEVVRVF